MQPVLLRIRQLLMLVVLQAVLLFVSAGSLRWGAGWWYIGLYVLMLAAAAFVMIPRRREVIEERSRGTRGGKSWDLILTRLMMIPSLGLLILSGLDWRWRGTEFLPLSVRLLGGILLVAGYLLVLWAMYTNSYFAQVVRIQKERGHAVVSGGPYRIVRHPGYLGMTVSMLGTVFLLGSFYGLACFALYLVLIVIRTSLEDRTLLAELPGYTAYALDTRFRLIPRVW